jgi:2-methylaconitate cis-trans-isomerase PrpF
VPGTGAEIVMNWVATVGAKTGRLLPTGSVAETIPLASNGNVRATLCDAGNPCAWVPAADLGLGGSELSDRIDEDHDLLASVAQIRREAAVRMGLATDVAYADEQSPGLPLVGLVAGPARYRTLSGGRVEAEDMDLRVRLVFMNRLHESIPGTGSISLAAASRIPGSVVEAATDPAARRRPGELRVGHPSGVVPVKVRTSTTSAATTDVAFEVLGFSRTARRLMDGTAYYTPSQ